MLTQTPGKLMMSLSLPAIVGMAVIGLYTFMDAVYAGQLIGMEAMGAVAVAYPFTFINSGGASMIGMGSASVLSRAIGAKDQRTIDQVMGNLVVMNLVLSLTVTIVGTVFARPVALFVPLVLILPNVAGLGIHGVWAASALSDGVMIVVAAFMVASVIRSLGKDEGSAADRVTMEEEAARA